MLSHYSPSVVYSDGEKSNKKLEKRKEINREEKQKKKGAGKTMKHCVHYKDPCTIMEQCCFRHNGVNKWRN